MVKASTFIAQVSDCHLSADPQTQYRGINPHHNLKTLMQKVKAMQPDLLLASGDLSEDGSPWIDKYPLLELMADGTIQTGII